MRFILNSAVITTPGRYTYRLIDHNHAKTWLSGGPFLSTIGYQETTDALSAITGIPISVNRVQIQMKSGDEALVFRLTVRLADPAVKGRINDVQWLLQHAEIGILVKE